MYNLNLLRQLCSDLSNEKDPQRFTEIASLLQAVIKEDQEEVRLRIGLLAKMYPVFAEFDSELAVAAGETHKAAGPERPWFQPSPDVGPGDL